MDELIAEFLTESNESLQELDTDLVNLEQDPNDKDLLKKIFRLMHTIKGTCGFLGLPRLEKVAHHAENVLGRFRDGELDVTEEYVTLIFESVDRVRWILGELEANGQEPAGSDDELLAKLDAAYEGKSLEQAEVAGSAETTQGQPQDTQEITADRDEEDEDSGQEEQAETDAAVEVVAETEDAPKQQNAPAGQDDKEQHKARESSVASQTLRVNVDVLEDLMTMVSELVLTRNQLLQIMRDQKESDFTSPLQRLNHVVSDLQEGVMKTRMQPIGNAWAKLPRIIRDISLELGKKIDLEMHGKDTELDRQVLEMIKDPLTHMVRNSADHGVETPDVRKAAGKKETGRVVLNAYHEGGHIIIEISDDGKGLSTEKIKKKAIANGLVSEEDLEGMTSQQIQQFIFKAGFSTAEQVTAVSGRGVGMDVVRTNIEKIGGSIELKSVEGEGSTFFIKIPLTLAIVSALIVESAGERFAIPQLAVRELVLASEKSDNRIENIKGSPVLRLREELLPLVSLQELMKLQNPATDGKTPPEQAPAPLQDTSETPEGGAADQEVGDNQYIIVAQVGSYQFGIIVDRVFDTEEIVVKPVASILRDIDLFSGNTILGDGTVIMILDPAGIAKSTGELGTSDTMTEISEEEMQAKRQGHEKTSLLLFKAGHRAPKAVPLALVARLEKINVADIEYSNNQMLIQYRGELMPLVKFNDDVEMDGEDRQKPVLVFTDKDRSLGLIVDDILDIVEEEINVQISAKKDNVLGSAIIAEKATDVIDVNYYLRAHFGDWFKTHDDTPYVEAHSASGTSGKKRVLLVDDSPFFRNMLTPLLSVAGYEVTTTESAQEALELCAGGHSFDIVVSDIEMPEMSGFEFAEQLKKDDLLPGTPLVALSSHATPQDIDRGKEAGFNNYVAKFDRDTLLETLNKTLAEHGGKS